MRTKQQIMGRVSSKDWYPETIEEMLFAVEHKAEDEFVVLTTPLAVDLVRRVLRLERINGFN